MEKIMTSAIMRRPPPAITVPSRWGEGGDVIELLTPTGTLRTSRGIQGPAQNRAKLT